MPWTTSVRIARGFAKGHTDYSERPGWCGMRTPRMKRSSLLSTSATSGRSLSIPTGLQHSPSAKTPGSMFRVSSEMRSPHALTRTQKK